MSDATSQQPDPAKAAGQALGGFLAWFSQWLNTQSALAVFAILMLFFVLFAGYWTVDKIIPNHIDRINAGYAAQQESHDKSIDKVVAAFKESSDRHEKHVKEILDIMREDRKPIAVNPLGGS